MKKTFVVLTLCLGVNSTLQASEWVLGPAFKPGWQPNFTLAGMGGYLKPEENVGKGATYAGLELSLDCPWFQPPSGTIRQQFWYGRYDKDGTELQSFEINPRYFVDVAPNLSVGIGPGFGYVKADTPFARGVDMASLQFGGDIHYRAGILMIGMGARYQVTTNKTLGPDQEGADNWVVTAKVGINF